ncbi:MAG: hypothetical protein HC772_18720 [Leptolyngbyaceae cyanobacterium CRU_2_3]|nr:hypothetical protein [Leptolyngbyaceae cyanobacterium CRU_2_3]
MKSLRKLLEAHTAYGEAVQQAEPAREIVNQLLGSQPPKQNTSNGKADPQDVEEKQAVEENQKRIWKKNPKRS